MIINSENRGKIKESKWKDGREDERGSDGWWDRRRMCLGRRRVYVGAGGMVLELGRVLDVVARGV